MKNHMKTFTLSILAVAFFASTGLANAVSPSSLAFDSSVVVSKAEEEHARGCKYKYWPNGTLRKVKCRR